MNNPLYVCTYRATSKARNAASLQNTVLVQTALHGFPMPAAKLILSEPVSTPTTDSPRRSFYRL